ncbi:MAG TPA: PxKF domain-containing protein [Blastocatellia bacterium]
MAFGNTVIVGFNDSGSNSGGTNRFTGYARSTDGGATFTDGGNLPTNPGGDAGDPVLARNNATGRIYFATLGFDVSTIQVFRSDDNGATWMPPVNGTPGGSSEDKQWMAVDNFPGPGQGNVYMVSRRFGAGPGIYFFRSTDNGETFGPNLGTQIVTNSQGAFVAVGPDHSVYAFWWETGVLRMRKSTDQGLTFGPTVTLVSDLTGGTNGDLGLTGIRQGTTTASGFRSNKFPHAVVNPVNGNIYVVYNNRPSTTDKCDIFVLQSTDGGATWSSPLRVNDDATTTDQWQPTLAITPDGANLGIFYYSRQEDPVNNNLFKFYGRIASVSGPTLSFAPSFAISDVPSLPEFGRDSLINATYMSDYDTAVATPGAFHVIWSDNRDDLPNGSGRKDPNVYYKRIDLTIHVTTTIPAIASVISNQPTTFTVNISEPADPATLAASDFTVNGIAASNFDYVPGSATIVFNFSSSPVTAQGAQTMSVAAGAFTSAAAGDLVAEFNGVFRYDTQTLQVIATNPAAGGVFTLPGPFTYDVTFNEPIDPASVQIGDLQLSGIAGSAVTAAVAQPGNTTVRFTINAQTEGALTATIPAGVITDTFGNIGLAFTGNYVVDIGTVPYPTPLLAKNPVGSLIYDPSITGNIGFASDTDSFTISIDPDQTVTAIVTGSGGLQPSVKLLKSPFNAIIGSATAAAANQSALLQTASTGDDGEHFHNHCSFHHPRFPFFGGGHGDHDDDHCPDFHAGKTFTFKVSGANGTTGNFTLQLILNSAIELEGTIAGKTNNTLAKAQNIDGSFIRLETSLASAKRGAVSGVTDSVNYTAAAVAPTFEDISGTGSVITGLTNVDDASVSIPIGFTFPLYGVNNTAVFVNSNGLLTFGAANTGFTNADLTTTPAQAAIAVFWDDLHTNGGQPGSNVFFQVSGEGVNQHLTIQWNQIRFFTGGVTADTITFQAQLFADGRIQLNYQDLTSGAVANNEGASASAGVKGAGAQGPNRLLLAFNNGPNDFVGTGKSALISPPNPMADIFSFKLSEGEANTLVIKSLSDTPADVALLDRNGAVIATGVSGATNVDNAISNFVAPETGVYYAKVTSSESVPYNLVVTRNATFDTEDNNTVSAAQPLDISRGALGAIVRAGAYQAAVVTTDFEDISGTGTVIDGLTGVDDASVSIPIGFSFPFYGVNNTEVFVNSNGLLTFGAANTAFSNTNLTASPAQAAIAVFWDDQHTDGGQPGSNVFFQVSGEGPDQHLTIQWNQIRFFTGGTAGDTITYQAQLFPSGRIRINYMDLASGAATGNDGASATAGVKAAGAQGPDRLLLAFNNGPNEFVGSGKSVQINQPAPEDWYSVTVIHGRLRFETSTPADGTGEFINTLDPHIELYDSAGTTLLATGTPIDDDRNESINVSGLPAPATYLVRVTSEGDTSGEYFLGSGAPPPFSGFFPPVGGNFQKAGSTIPIKFSFGLNLGLDILAPGSPASRQVNCSTGAGAGSWEPAESAPGLQYNPWTRQYIYTWSTKKAWAGTCRELDVTVRDGRHFTTKFKFW